MVRSIVVVISIGYQPIMHTQSEATSK